ncbi:MAG: hypothetical protein WAQ52_16870 [Terriglobales bacterium]
MEAGHQRRAAAFGILNALSFGALLVLLIIASHTGLFLALIAAKV